MYIRRIYVSPEPKTEYKDKLYRIPTIVMRILLFLSFAFYGWHMAESMVNSIPYMIGGLDIDYITALVIGHILDGIISLAVFEIVGTMYYTFVRPVCPPVPLSKNAFMVYLRAAYLVRNVVAGIIKLFVYTKDLYVFTFDPLINLAMTVIVLSLTCAYVMVKYVPNSQKARFLKAVSVPFLAYEIIVTLMGFVG